MNNKKTVLKKQIIWLPYMAIVIFSISYTGTYCE